MNNLITQLKQPLAILVWAAGHIAIAALYISTFQLEWSHFWQFSIVHWCWIEINKEFHKRNF